MKAPIVEQFRDKACILIGTEAAAEGINLQFCSLVVNYDLSWNQQRIEQRIGRCHRYGHKNDVVVINFLNQKNAADRRVYELLDQKFKLFGETRVIMEHTRRYHEPIAQILHQSGIYVSAVNPKLIKNYGNNSLRKVKTDKADSKKIARYGLDKTIIFICLLYLISYTFAPDYAPLLWQG